MIWFGAIGIVALVLSLLYLFSPNTIERLDRFGKRIVLTTDMLLRHRRKTSLFLLVVGISLIYIGFFLR